MHLTMCVLVGLLYGAMLPMLPTRPIVLGGIIATSAVDRIAVLRSGLHKSLTGPKISWIWFAASQVGFGVVAGLVVARQNKVWTTENVPLAVRAGMEAPGIMMRATARTLSDELAPRWWQAYCWSRSSGLPAVRTAG